MVNHQLTHHGITVLTTPPACHTHFPPPALGALPSPHLLASVPLAISSQSTPPVTTSAPVVPPVQPIRSTPLPLPTTQAGLVLSPAAEPFPRKVVDKVRSGQFIELRELLADNITLVQQLESMHGYAPLPMVGPSRPRLREVSSLSTWCYCFLGYMAIQTSDPSTRDQLAYARLVIREALRHGGTGWMDYDRASRQQAAADPSLRWNTLQPGLQATTILGQRNRQEASFCTLCHGVDHVRAQCALTYLHPTATRSQPTSYAATRSSPGSYPAGTRRKSENVCFSWNKGTCVYPGYCYYRHVCATCYLNHKARDCPRTQDNSPFKQTPRGPLPPPFPQQAQGPSYPTHP